MGLKTTSAAIRKQENFLFADTNDSSMKKKYFEC